MLESAGVREKPAGKLSEIALTLWINLGTNVTMSSLPTNDGDSLLTWAFIDFYKTVLQFLASSIYLLGLVFFSNYKWCFTSISDCCQYRAMEWVAIPFFRGSS